MMKEDGIVADEQSICILPVLCSYIHTDTLLGWADTVMVIAGMPPGGGAQATSTADSE